MESVASKDGTSIAFDRTGRGPAVILVGGAFSYRKFPGAALLAELLSEHFTVINYDRRGRGDSGDTKPYEVQREVEDLEALIEVAGGLAHVWGLSSGGALAIIAAASGLNIGKLAVYEPPYMVGDVGHRPPRNHQAQVTALIAENRRSAAVKYFLRDVMGLPGVIVAIMRLLPFWAKLKATANSLPYDSAVMGDFSLPVHQLGSVRVPTLAIAGERTIPVLLEASKEVARAIPGCQHRVLRGQSHNVSMKTLAPVLVEFFKS